jgi:hypothetical protein
MQQQRQHKECISMQLIAQIASKKSVACAAAVHCAVCGPIFLSSLRAESTCKARDAQLETRETHS